MFVKHNCKRIPVSNKSDMLLVILQNKSERDGKKLYNS